MSPIHSSVPFRSSQYIEKFWRVWGDLNSQNWRVSRKSWFTCKIKKITYKRGFHSDTGLKVDHRWVVEPEDKLRLTHVVPAREKIPVGCSQCFQSWKLPLSDFFGLSRQKWRNDAWLPQLTDDDNAVAQVDVLLSWTEDCSSWLVNPQPACQRSHPRWCCCLVVVLDQHFQWKFFIIH